MHLGYFAQGVNPFHLENMLDEMPKQVFQRLQLNTLSRGTVLDLGCGIGASMCIGAKLFPRHQWHGVTIVPEQQAFYDEMSDKPDAVTVALDDYERLSLPNESVEYVYALESMSHASGTSKSPLLAEMYRLVKPGGRFAIADGFLQRPPADLSKTLQFCHDELCRGWALPAMGVVSEIVRELQKQGFREIEVEDISWRVAPSVAHIPYVTLKFLVQRLMLGHQLGKRRRDHLKSCAL